MVDTSELCTHFVFATVLCLINAIFHIVMEEFWIQFFPVEKNNRRRRFKRMLDAYNWLGSFPRWFRTSSFVLTHELFPVKSTSPLFAGSNRDFLMSLQKMDFNEANFIIQSNQLDLPMIPKPPIDFKPGTSTYDPVASTASSDAHLCPSLPVDHPFSPLTLDSLLSDLYKDENASTSEDLVVCAPVSSPVTIETTEADYITFEERGIPNSPSVDLTIKFEDAIDVCPIESEAPTNACSQGLDCSSSVNLHIIPERSFTPSVACDPTFIFNTLKSEPNVSAHEPSFGDSQQTNCDSKLCCDQTECFDETPVSSNSSPPLSFESSRPSRRKSPIQSYSPGILSDDWSASFDSDSDSETCTNQQGSSCSDSELRQPHPSNRRKVGQRNGKKTRPSFSVWLKSVKKTYPRENVDVDSWDNGFSHAMSTELDDYGQTPSSSGTSHDQDMDSKRLDRHLRDVDLLELYNVPFSYSEVVNCTNEEFRDLKASPDLSPEQIEAMLDARRRATNRQAAERCRRLKSALRDDLAERLANLRLQRDTVQKQLVRARQRRQQARESLTTEQTWILALLRGPDGNRLSCADWRVRLTNEDEVVVVAVGQ